MRKVKIDSGNMHADLGVNEQLFALNFESHFPDLIDYLRASFELSDAFMASIAGHELNQVQEVCVFFLAKSRRLLITIHKLASQGYWPEAEIIFRTFFEMQHLLLYMIEDKSDSRFEVWMKRANPKQSWPMKEILKTTPELEGVYSYLSLYPHTHNLSTKNHVRVLDKDLRLDAGPLFGEESFLRAKNVVGTAAMMNGAILEIISSRFVITPQFQEKHEQLIAMPFHQEQSSKAPDHLSAEFIQRILSKIAK